MRVSCRRHHIAASPVDESEGRGLVLQLLQITSVSNTAAESVLSVVGGELVDHHPPQPPTVAFSMYCFRCESVYAAHYLAEQIVTACRLSFNHARSERARRNAEILGGGGGRAADSPRTPRPPRPPRTPTKADELFYEQHALLMACAADGGDASAPGSPTRSPAKPDRGDGLWHTCCRTLGACRCGERGSWATATAAAADLRPRAAEVDVLSGARAEIEAAVAVAGRPVPTLGVEAL